MIEVIDRRQEGKLKEHGPMIAVVVLFATVVLLGFLSVVAVLATPPL